MRRDIPDWSEPGCTGGTWLPVAELKRLIHADYYKPDEKFYVVDEQLNQAIRKRQRITSVFRSPSPTAGRSCER